MRWQGMTVEEKRDRFWSWQVGFAWLPVQTQSGEWVWLEKVYSKRVSRGFNGLWYWVHLSSLDAIRIYEQSEADFRQRLRDNPMPNKK